MAPPLGRIANRCCVPLTHRIPASIVKTMRGRQRYRFVPLDRPSQAGPDDEGPDHAG